MDTSRFPFGQFNMPEVNNYAQDLENIAPLDNVGWVKNVVNSTQFNRIDMYHMNQLKFVATFYERGRFMYHYFTDLDFRWTIQGGLKMLSIQLDSIESTRII